MKVSELAYELPSELVARRPPARREDARLLVVGGRSPEHRSVRDLPELLPPASLLVVNDTRVLPARLVGRKASGGRVEVLLVRRLERADDDPPTERWTAMIRGRVRPGTELVLGARLAATCVRPADDEGVAEILLHAGGLEPMTAIEAEGLWPLPPYLEREAEEADRERYQTRFARVPGAVAAPTAGLHFGDELLAAVRARGIAIAKLTLHVGPGTFRPVTVDDLDDHPMHAEPFRIGEDVAAAVAAARARGGPVVAVGTTVVRALESAADPERQGLVRAMEGDTRLLVQPGYRFRVVDALVTNFHLPGSTLLALVYAFGGIEPVRAAYGAAIAERYRFFSYGDAMLLRRAE
jgi:S-adenosylmethionine:tRNA ribosyltransferase-isomerase